MTPSRDDIFSEAREISDPAQRSQFVADACGEDAALRLAVEAMLQDAEKAAAFFESNETESTLRVSSQTTGTVIGRYKLLEKIGEGGMGVVYMAEQREPVVRKVALKIIKAGMDTRQVVARFEAERQALALMDHPNIAKVLDGGTTETGRLYFVMDLVQGLPITQFCDEARLSMRERLELFLEVCSAIQHAHQKGIIHRDIKPSNILVTLHGDKPVPKVIDFGIAKATQQPLTDKTLFTQFQHFIGTPAYMSPEQAGLSGLDIDTRSDVYGLGVLLYELLTGKTPFDGKELLKSGLDEMRRTIREKEPPRPSTRLSTLSGGELTTTAQRRSTEAPRLIHQLRGDLDWIAMKCLEKDRSRRYETANGLAADINRFLNNEPVIARPPSSFYRLQKLLRRNKLAFTAGAGVAAALVIGLGLSTWLFIRETKAHKQASDAERKEALLRTKAEGDASRAEASELAVRRIAYVSDMNLAQEALRMNNLRRVRTVLERQRPLSGKEDLRGWEWRYLWGQCIDPAQVMLPALPASTNSAVCMPSFVLSQDAHSLAVRQASRLRLLSLPNRVELTNIACQGTMRSALSFDDAGKLLAVAEDAQGRDRVRLFRMPSFEELPSIEVENSILRASLSPDGRWLASLCRSNQSYFSSPYLQVWDLSTQIRPAAYTRLAVVPLRWVSLDRIGAIGWNSDSRLLAVGDAQGQVRVFDLPGCTERTNVSFALSGYESPDTPFAAFGITAIAFSRAGNFLAAACETPQTSVRVFDTSDWHEVARLDGHSAWVAHLAFSPDGRTLASAGADQTIRLWNWAEAREISTLRGHLGAVRQTAFTADGTTLFSAGADGAILCWSNVLTLRKQERLRLPVAMFGFALGGLAFSRDGNTLALVGRHGAISTFTGSNYTNATLLPALGTNNSAVTFSPDGQSILTGTMGGEIRVWDCRQQRLLHSALAAPVRIFQMKFANAETLATFEHPRSSSNDIVCRLWRVKDWSNQGVVLFPVRSAGQFADFVERGQILITPSDDGWVDFRRTTDGKTLHRFQAHPSRIGGMAVSPDGRRFATASDDGTARLWDATSRQLVAELRAHFTGVEAVEFSPDGSRLITGSTGGQAIKVWDLRTMQETLNLSESGATFHLLRFSPDGNTLAGVSFTEEVFLWHAPSWTEIDAGEKTQDSTQQVRAGFERVK